MSTQLKQNPKILQQIIELLYPLSDEDRARHIRSIMAFFGVDASTNPVRATGSPVVGTTTGNYGREAVFSEHEELSPKTFMVNKYPKTDVDRIACLAYYLANYRDMKYFKTSDISALNTEAAQRKLANASYAMKNAATIGYLVPALKTQKQLSSFGEQYVETLPDYEAAKEVSQRYRRKRTTKKKKRLTHKK